MSNGPRCGIGACLESGRNTERACNTAARSCPNSLSKFPGRTWTSGSARGKHVIKLVQVPCPSSCPSSGFRPGPSCGIGACLELGRNTERACNTAARSCPLAKWLCKRKTRDKICPSSLSKFLSKFGLPPGVRRTESRPAWNRGAPARILILFFFPEALRRVLLLKAAANFTCQLLMPTCRELLHLPTSHANLSRVTSPANFSCQLVESYFTC